MKKITLSSQIIPKYYPSFKDTTFMHKIFTSGRAGTKSSRGGLKAVWKVISDDDCAVFIIRKKHNKLSSTVFKEVLRAIKRLGMTYATPKSRNKNAEFYVTNSPMQIKYLKNGNIIYFTGSDGIDDTKGMIDENNTIKLVIIDEVTEFFDHNKDGEGDLTNIVATFVRGNDDEFCVEYYFNPPRNPKAPVMEWTRKMEAREDCLHIHTDYRDVPRQWLGEKLIAEAEAMKIADEKLYRWLWLGETTGLDDLIYYMFDESKHVAEPTLEQLDAMNYLVIGIDYGQMNATTYQCFGLDYKNKCMRGIDEYYYSGRDSGHQRSPSEYAMDFKGFKERVEVATKKRVAYVYIDPSAKGLQEEIKRVCPDIKPIGADNTVLLGINRIQKMMSLGYFYMSPKQKNLIGEMYLYEWNKDALDRGSEVPIKQSDHCCDAIRYATMGQWHNIKRLLPMLEGGEK